MTFSSPAFLLLLLAALPLAALWLRDENQREKRMQQLVARSHLDVLAAGHSPRRRRLRRGLLFFSYCLLAFAAAGPQGAGKTVLLPAQGVDVLFAVDVSRSMRARDVLPDRLERAKAEIAAFLPLLAGNRVGIVAFAGTAFVQCPLTADIEAVHLFLRDLSPESVPQGGTALAQGLDVAVHAFRAEDEARGDNAAKAGRIVVVITDGEDHQGGIDKVAQTVKDAGIDVVLIGVGSTLGEPVPQFGKDGTSNGYLRDRTGQTVISRMNPEAMRAAASALGGTFVDGNVEPELGLRELQARLSKLEKRELQARTHIEKVDRSSIFSAAAILAMLAALVISERSRRHT